MIEVIPNEKPIIIPGLTITNSHQIVSANTKLAMLLWAPSGMGKTSLAGSLDRLTRKFDGRPTLYIPVEQSEGGGAVTIRGMGINMYIPKDYSDLNKALGILRNDKTFAGVVLDSATELVKQHIKPAALKYPPKENFATRAVGVPTRSDYQVLGELTSQTFRALIAMTAHEKPEYRKHVIITATDKSVENDNDKIVWRGPDLPGRMASEAAAMFQINATIKAKSSVVDGKRKITRVLCTETDGVEALKDRFEVMPSEIPLAKAYTDGSDGEDLASIWEKYWLPAMK